jgi:hypothetical protein
VPIGDTLSAAGATVCGSGVSLSHGYFSPRGTWVAVAAYPTKVWLYDTTQLQAGRSVPVRRYDIDFAAWEDDARLILADEPTTVVLRCPTTAAACERVTGAPERVLGVIRVYR